MSGDEALLTLSVDILEEEVMPEALLFIMHASCARVRYPIGRPRARACVPVRAVSRLGVCAHREPRGQKCFVSLVS